MPIDAVDRFLTGLGARCLAEGEWGLTVPDEHPLDIGIRVSDGLVRVQAFAVPAADAPASEDVLHWNRTTRIVRFSRTGDGDVWVQADVVVEAADEAAMDRVLGLVVEAARSAREAAYAKPLGDANRWLARKQG
jgi:hypothetical protein